MNVAFYVTAAVAVIATAMVITRANAVHALLYLVVSLVAVAGVMFELGAPFAAALEVIVYAGAIVVLFVFVVMLLGQTPAEAARERAWLAPNLWVGPSLLALVLLVELGWIASAGDAGAVQSVEIPAKAVGALLYVRYIVAVEAASFLLLAGLVGAWHLGRRIPGQEEDT